MSDEKAIPTVVKNTLAVFIPPEGVPMGEFEAVKNVLSKCYIHEAHYLILPPGWSVTFAPIEGRHMNPADFWGWHRKEGE